MTHAEKPGPTYTLDPRSGIGRIRLGMTRDQVVAELGRPLLRDAVPGYAAVLIYNDEGLRVHPTLEGVVTEITVDHPSQLLHVQVALLGRPLRTVSTALRNLGFVVDLKPPVAVVPSLGLRLFIENGHTMSATVFDPDRPMPKASWADILEGLGIRPPGGVPERRPDDV